MNKLWQTFLKQQGARLDDGMALDFGDPRDQARAAVEQNVIADLSHLGRIAAQGEEARSFLQAQLSCDVQEVAGTRSSHCAYCSPKGRVLAAVRVFMRGSELWLQLPRDILEPTLQRLRMFVLRSKVTLEDESDRVVGIGTSGPRIEGVLEKAVGELPAGVDDVLQHEELTVVRTAGPYPRFELVTTPEQAREIWTTLAPATTPVGAGAWSLLDVRAGIPAIHRATMDAFLPQMLNLHALEAVSFTKGCYPGQEVVARMRYLGTLKRRTYRAHADTDQCPTPGAELFSPVAEGSQGAGRVLEAQPAPEGGFELLAVVQVGAAEHSGLRLKDENGPPIHIRDLPYSVELARA